MRRTGEGAFRGLTSSGWVSSRPRVFRVEDNRAAWYPDDMALYLLDPDERAPVRTVPEPIPPDLPDETAFRGLIMFPTHACNLACRYCYIGVQGRRKACPPSRRPADLMTDRTVCRAMDLLWKSKRVMVSFFGGEPILAWGKIEWAVERAEAMARERGGRPKLHLTTNATLITEERAAYLAEHKFSVIASLDGPRDLHDAERVTVDGRGSYDDALRGIRTLRRHVSSRVTLRGTYRPGEAPGDFVRRLEHLNALCDDGLADVVAVEPATYCGGACDGPVGGYARGEILRNFDAGVVWAVARARSGGVVRWAHLNKTLQRLTQRRPAWTECGAGTGILGVSPDGTLHACHHEGCVVGHVNVGVDPTACEPWRDSRLHEREDCGRCWARLLCGGGCRMEGWHEGGAPAHGPVACAVGRARSLAAIKVAAALAGDADALRLARGEACGSGSSERPAASAT